MRRRTKRFLAAALVFSVASAFSFSAVPMVSADTLADYPISNGHFFTQAAPGSGATNGYSITNEYGIPFWDAFQDFGGVDNLGYPCSRRFVWQGCVSQVTEKAILQWNTRTGQVLLANVMDEMSMAGKNDWLEQEKLIARPAERLLVVGNESWDEIVSAHHALLNGAPVSRAYYFAMPLRAEMLGLPTSRPEDLGPCYSVRFQRGALYIWKQATNEVSQGRLTMASVGQIAHEAGLFDESVFQPEPAPVAQEARLVEMRSGTDRGGTTRLAGTHVGAPPVYGTMAWQGNATYYGADFQGSLMRNGEPFDMYDPTITASNVYPLGSILLVTNTWSGNTIRVRVTDTGAFRYPILVDLSYAAFCLLASPSAGVIPVLVERIE